MLIGVQTVKASNRRFTWEHSPLEVELEAMIHTPEENFSTFCLFPVTLQETEIKDSGHINLSEEISRQPNI